MSEVPPDAPPNDNTPWFRWFTTGAAVTEKRAPPSRKGKEGGRGRGRGGEKRQRRACAVRKKTPGNPQ